MGRESVLRQVVDFGRPYYDEPCLAYGRTCLSAIFSVCEVSKLYLPYYICGVVLDTVKHYNIEYCFYKLDSHLRMDRLIELKTNEYILSVNYFGVLGKHMSFLSGIYGERLIIDNTQAFFEKPDVRSWSFNSCRKFFGIADGAYLFSPHEGVYDYPENTIKSDYLDNKLYGFQELAYNQYRESEDNIGCDLKTASSHSMEVLSRIDYKKVATRRLRNYQILKEMFSDKNDFEHESPNYAPMCYPLLLKKPLDRRVLAKRAIFIPIYWLEIKNDLGYEVERRMANNLVPLPVDQGLDFEDLNKIKEVVDEVYYD